jgi:hypothetical protein
MSKKIFKVKRKKSISNFYGNIYILELFSIKKNKKNFRVLKVERFLLI